MARILVRIAAVLFLGFASAAWSGTAVPPFVPGPSGMMPPVPFRPSGGTVRGNRAPQRDRRSPASAAARTDTFRIAGVMIEFVADSNGPTSGDGTFGTVKDANEVVFGGVEDPDPYRADHDADYFREQLAYLTQYYRAVSYGRLEIEATVIDTVFTASRTMAYYGDNDSVATRQPILFREAVLLADPLVDFSAYDAVVVIHAGVGEETDVLGDSPGDLWTTYYTPGDLAGALADSGMAGDYPGIATDDVDSTGDTFHVREGVLLPETETQDGFAQWLLGVAAHMTGRLLGAPSLFDPTPSGFSDSQGIGNFGIMGTGLWNSGGILPPHPCAWTKMRLGWIDPLVIRRDTTIVLPLVERADSPVKALLIPINESEYFLLENRYPDENGDGAFNFDDANGDNRLDLYDDSYDGAEFDWSLPAEGSIDGSGVLIWHIDEEKIARSGDFREVNEVNADASWKGVDLEEADGIQDLDVRATSFDNFGGPYDAWSTANMYLQDGARFGPGTNPSTSANFGASTGITIEVKSGPDSVMTVTIDFPDHASGWPVERDGEGRLAGPAVPVELPGRSIFFAAAFYDSGAGEGRGDLVGADGTEAPGWPVVLPGKPSFSPVYGTWPGTGGAAKLIFPLADGSLVWYGTDGSLIGSLPALPGTAAHYCSGGSVLSGLISLVATEESTTVYRLSGTTREEIARFAGRAVGPAVIGPNVIFAVGGGT